MAGFIDQPGNPEQSTFGMSGGGDMVGAIINTGGMLYDSYQNRKAARQNTDKTIAAQKAESELAYQRSIEEWNRQNMYNDPESQMARFKAAGLNPHLIYGQGNAGNASSPPEYHPANLQYRYEAPQYGAAIASALPTLMQVGTWVQNMRLGQAQISKTQTEVERSQQMIDFLQQRNPKELSKMENMLSLYPYQYQMQQYNTDKGRQQLYEMEQKFRYDYGEDLFGQMGTRFGDQYGNDLPQKDIGGMKRLQFLQQSTKNKLADLDLGVKSSWADFDITNPQAIIQMVLAGVLRQSGAALKMPSHSKPAGLPSRRRTGEMPSSVRRLHPSRRVQNRH